MEVIWKRDVDGIHEAAPETLIELVVGEAGFHLVAAAELFQLLGIVRYQRCQFRVLRVGKRWQDRHLRNVAEAEHPVTDLPLRSVLAGLFTGGWHCWSSTAQKGKQGFAGSSQRGPVFSRTRDRAPGRSLQRSTTLDQLHDSQNDGNHQQHMDKTAQAVRRDDTQQPEHQEYHEDRPQHGYLLTLG